MDLKLPTAAEVAEHGVPRHLRRATTLLDQGYYWIPKALFIPRILLIEDMDEGHRRNTHAMLLRQAGRWERAYCFELITLEVEAGEDWSYAHDRLVKELGVEEWMRSRALMRALEA